MDDTTSEKKIKIRCTFDSLVDVDHLKPHPKNRNKHPDSQLIRLGQILEYQGWRYPIKVSNLSGFITSGHGRLEAAKLLGLKKVPVNFQDYESEEQEYADLTSDNAIALWSELDLAGVNHDLGELGPNFDIDLLGLKNFTLDVAEKLDPKCNEDEVPEAKESITKPGDLYILGNHRLLCGDSTNIQHVQQLMDKQTPELVFTDPPYRMAVEGGSDQPIGRAAAKLGEAIKHLCDFDPQAFLNTLAASFESGKMNAYIFCNKDLVPDYLNWAIEAGYNFNILFWKKPNAIPLGGNHRPDVEYLLLFRKSAVWNNAVEGVSYSKCLEYNRELSKDHPTLKPVELICNEILISSNKDGAVLDLFGGSGSTLIACEKTNRNCFMMELDPKYCDVIVARWEKYTGKKAVLERPE